MKYSLHIGLNNVDPLVYGGWNGQLTACEKDADDLAEVAIELGYQASKLITPEATIKRVLDALHYYANLATAGDTIFITYSGHGGQIPDRSGDEKDGLDETWVLYDGMLIDDLLHQAYAAFKKGVRLIVLSDSCHSGTVVKRMRQEDFDNWNHLKKSPVIKSAPTYVCREYAGPLDTSKPIMRPRVKATVVLISGCQDNQFSYDGEENGLFTGTLLKVYDKGKFKGGYKALRKAIVKQMPPEQTPQYLTMGAKDKYFEESPVFTGI